MTGVQAKICGLNDPASVATAVAGGASHLGLVFFPPSPRSVTPGEAARLVKDVPKPVKLVGLFVDPDDAWLTEILRSVKLDLIQLHGSERIERVRAIREIFKIPVMKALKVATAADLEDAGRYASVADMLLFDAKAPKELKNALPGGNGLVFDWRILANMELSVPWMLAGGLDKDNVAQAVTISGAKFVDTSSGVEEKPGKKDPRLITDFLAAVHAIE
ncbi:MAG: phosphoribosylanthranilate isomerase [Sneathiella sp.]